MTHRSSSPSPPRDWLRSQPSRAWRSSRDGYSDAWHKEAGERGLPNLATTVDSLPGLDDEEVKSLFETYGVLSKRELHSRLEVYVEQYCKSVNVFIR